MVSCDKLPLSRTILKILCVISSIFLCLLWQYSPVLEINTALHVKPKVLKLPSTVENGKSNISAVVNGILNTSDTGIVIKDLWSVGNVTERTKPVKYILFWTKFFSEEEFNFGFGNAPFINAKCPISDCYTTNNRSLVQKSDAIVFHLRDFRRKDIPKYRTPNQLYVFLTMESVSNGILDFHQVRNGFFNISMTYRRDSDIVMPYGRLIKNNIDWSEKYTTAGNYFKNKTKLCAWFVSNCLTLSRRESFVKKLQKYMKIDIYGSCGTLECTRNNESFCNEILRSYKFYLAFENSLCEDYVTEKFYRALQYDVLPVVYGLANYSEIAPPHSYINSGDFSSAEELADYLLVLSKNETLYNEYFEWKRYYRVDLTERSFCDLCAVLYNKTFHKTYDDFKQWWSKGKICKYKFL